VERCRKAYGRRFANYRIIVLQNNSAVKENRLENSDERLNGNDLDSKSVPFKPSGAVPEADLRTVSKST